MACICNTSQDRKCPIHDREPVSPSGGVWVEWEHLCSRKGERVLTTKGLRCKSCGLHEDDRDTDGVKGTQGDQHG